MPFVDGEYQDGEARGRMYFGGASGFGKTTEMLRLCDAARAGVVFFDTTGRHSLRGAKYVEQPVDLKNELLRRLDARFRIVYQPTCGEIEEHFRAACAIVAAFGGMVFAVDEIDSFCGPEWGRSWMPPELYTLVHFGRHQGAKELGRRGVALLYTARIPSSVARALTSQASELRLFHEHDPIYVKYYRGVVGDVAVNLATLPKFKFYACDPTDSTKRVLGGGARRV